MAVPTFFLRPYFLFVSCFGYLGCVKVLGGACWSDVCSMYSTPLVQACSRRVFSLSRRETYHNVDFASQWLMPSIWRTARQASLLNMTSHACGRLHHWKSVSTLRCCNRTAMCLRGFVRNCLRPGDASFSEWKVACLCMILATLAYSNMHLSYRNVAFYGKNTSGSNFFSPTVLFSRGKNVGIQRSLSSVGWKNAGCALDSILVLYCSERSRFL